MPLGLVLSRSPRAVIGLCHTSQIPGLACRARWAAQRAPLLPSNTLPLKLTQPLRALRPFATVTPPNPPPTTKNEPKKKLDVVDRLKFAFDHHRTQSLISVAIIETSSVAVMYQLMPLIVSVAPFLHDPSVLPVFASAFAFTSIYPYPAFALVPLVAVPLKWAFPRWTEVPMVPSRPNSTLVNHLAKYTNRWGIIAYFSYRLSKVAYRLFVFACLSMGVSWFITSSSSASVSSSGNQDNSSVVVPADSTLIELQRKLEKKGVDVLLAITFSILLSPLAIVSPIFTAAPMARLVRLVRRN